MPETPTVMEMIKAGFGRSVHFTDDPKNPNRVTATIDKHNVEITAGTQGFSVKVEGHNGDAPDPYKVLRIHGKVAKIFDAPEQKLSNIREFRGDSTVKTQLTDTQLTHTHATQQAHQRSVTTATQSVLRSAVVESNGTMRPELARAQMMHEVSHAIGVAPAHNLLAGPPPESPAMREAREALSDFQRMLRGEKPESAQKPAVATNPHPESEFTQLIKKGTYTPKDISVPIQPVAPIEVPHTAPQHAPHAPSGHIGKIGKGAGLFGTLLAVAGAANAAPSGKKLEAAIDVAPGVEQARQGNVPGALVQLVGSFDPTMGFGEAALNKFARERGIDVPKTMLEEAVGKGRLAIPQKVLHENIRMARVAEGLLTDAGLGRPDQHGKTGADYLRDSNTRGAYIAALKDETKIEAAKEFCEIEGRRLAKLQPHMKGVEEKLVATLKAQSLAQQFQLENGSAPKFDHGDNVKNNATQVVQRPQQNQGRTT